MADTTKDIGPVLCARIAELANALCLYNINGKKNLNNQSTQTQPQEWNPLTSSPLKIYVEGSKTMHGSTCCKCALS